MWKNNFNPKGFKVPTTEELSEIFVNRVTEASDEELFKLYNKVNEDIKVSKDNGWFNAAEDYLKKKEIVITQFKIRNLKIPLLRDRILYSYLNDNLDQDEYSGKTKVQREYLRQIDEYKRKNQ